MHSKQYYVMAEGVMQEPVKTLAEAMKLAYKFQKGPRPAHVEIFVKRPTVIEKKMDVLPSGEVKYV